MGVRSAFIPGNTLLHKLHPASKMLLVFGIIIAAFTTTNVAFLFMLLLFLIAIWLYSGIPASRFKTVFKIIAFLAVLFIFFYTAFSPTVNKTLFMEPVFPAWIPIIGGFGGYYVEGLLLGLATDIRLLVLIMSLPPLMVTTAEMDLILGLLQVGIPYEFAFLLTTSLRFVPTITETRERILEAQKLRGLRLEGGLISRIKSTVPIFVPLIITSIRMTQNLQIAIESRAFGAKKKRTTIRELKFTNLDKAFCIATLTTIAIAVYIGFFMIEPLGDIDLAIEILRMILYTLKPILELIGYKVVI